MRGWKRCEGEGERGKESGRMEEEGWGRERVGSEG